MRCVLAFLFLLLWPLGVMAQTFEWGKIYPSPNHFTMEGAVGSTQGGFFSHGYFQYSLTLGGDHFDIGDRTNAFMARHATDGNVIWTRILDFSEYSNARSSTVDANGSVYVTGYFSGSITFAGETISKGSGDDLCSYVAKFDGSGLPQWIVKLSNITEPVVQTDKQGNILVTGSDYYTVQPQSSWLFRFEPDGDLISKKNLTQGFGPWMYAIPASTAINSSGDIFIAGYFTGDVLVGNATLSLHPNSIVNNNLFLAKFDASGNFVWAEDIGSQAFEGEVTGQITVDDYCNIYVTGWIGDRTMLTKLDGAGQMIWKKEFGLNNRVFGQDVVVDAGGNVYFMAMYYNTTTIDSYTLPGTYGPVSTLVSKLDAQGNIQWIVNTAPGLSNASYKIARGTANDLYIVGSSDASLSISNLSLTADMDPFILKLNMPAVSPLPPAEAGPTLNLGPDVKLCMGETKKIGMPGFSKYTWENGSTDSTRIVSAAGTYSLTVLDRCGNKQEDEVVVTMCDVSPPLDLGPDLKLCPGIQMGISLFGYDGYLWQDGSTLNTYTITGPGTYYVTVQNLEGGIQQDTLVITAKEIPLLNLGTDQLLCEGATLVLSTSGFVSYEWQDGSTAQSYLVTEPGTYSVQVIDSCGNAHEDSIIIEPCAHPDLELGEDIVICKDETHLLALDDFVSYRWQDGSTGPSYLIKEPGLYFVTTIDEYGLMKRDTLRARACLFFPNVITPNGDHLNDSFIIEGLDERYQHELRIVNRWGMEVYFSNDYKNNWAGNGLSSALYFYTFVEGKTRKRYRGWIQVYQD